MGILELLNGWRRCEPPKWWNVEREMRKWKTLPDSFRFKGKHFKYKAIYKNSKDSCGSSSARFEASYKFYRKKRSEK